MRKGMDMQVVKAMAKAWRAESFELRQKMDLFEMSLRKSLAKQFGFSFVGPFSEEGIATAVKGAKQLYVRRDGTRLVLRNEKEYFGLEDFHEGVAWAATQDVVLDGYGYRLIDVNGNEIPLPHLSISDHNPSRNGWVRIKGNYLNKQGKLLFGKEKLLTKPYSNLEELTDYSEGVASFADDSTDPRTWHLIHTNGEIFGPELMERPSPASEGMIGVRTEEGACFLDLEGNEVFPSLKFDAVGGFHDGFARVRMNGRMRYLEKTGEFLGDPNDTREPLLLDEASDFSEGLACVTKGGRVYYIDRTGKAAFETPSFIIVFGRSFKEGRAAVKLSDGTWTYINRHGCSILCLGIPLRVRHAPGFDHGVDRVVLKGEERSRYIDRDGNTVFD